MLLYNLIIPLVSPQLFSSDFWFMGITILYLLTSCFTARVLFHQSPTVIILYHTCSLLHINYCISTCSCMLVPTARFSCLWSRFIDTHVLTHARHLAFASPLAWGVLTPLDPHVQVLELGACESPSCWSEWRSGSVDLQQTVQSSILSGPLCASRVFLLYTRECLLYCSYLYIYLYSRICACRWCNILVIFITSGDNFIIVLMCWNV